jgi:hypothetical protein
MLNAVFVLRKFGYEEDALDADFITALALISCRKFVQACELFRRIERQILLKVDSILFRDNIPQGD